MKDISLPNSLRGSVMRMLAVGVERIVVVVAGVGTALVQACREEEEEGSEGTEDGLVSRRGAGRNSRLDEWTLRFILDLSLSLHERVEVRSGSGKEGNLFEERIVF
jgi:hypothetical protein